MYDYEKSKRYFLCLSFQFIVNISAFNMWKSSASCDCAAVCAVIPRLKCQAHVSAAEIGQAQHTQIDKLLILFHGLCRWRKRMPMQKDQNPCARETSVLLLSAAAEQDKEEPLNRSVSRLELGRFSRHVLGCSIPPARYLFLDPFVGTAAMCASV